MFVVDTNVLVYAANRDAPQSDEYRERLEGWRRQATPWYLTWSIVYEFLRIATHRRVLQAPWTLREAWTFVEALLASPSLHILTETDGHHEMLAALVRELPDVKGNLLHDAHIAVLMREHGIGRVVTLDGDFRRFPFLKIVHPLG